jgi:hypothetical protein
MAKANVFISFDYDHYRELKDSSVKKELSGDWKEKVRH